MPFNTSITCEGGRDVKIEPDLSELDIDSNTDDLRRACGEETYQDLLCYSRSLVQSTEAAEDIVQQAFTNTMTAIERGVQIDNMGGFLYRCVRNLCVNHVSREPRHSRTEEIMLVAEQSAASSAELRYRWQKVEDTVDKLPSSQRYAFLLAEVRGLHYDEIADLMDRSTNSVRQLLNRAREKVRSKADTGWDWGIAPTPVVAAESAPESWYNSLSSSVSDWVHPRVSDLQSWVGNVSQSCSDSLLQCSSSLATGLVIVGVIAISPAPSTETPVEQDIRQAEPIAVTVESPGPLVSRPHSNKTSAQAKVKKPRPASTVAALLPSDVADRSKTVIKEKSPADKRTVAKAALTVDNDNTKNLSNTRQTTDTGQDNEVPELKFKTYTAAPPRIPPEPEACTESDPYAEKLAQIAQMHASGNPSTTNGATTTQGTGSAVDVNNAGNTNNESSDITGDQDGDQPDSPETDDDECTPEITVQ